jgi:DNA modification methylase
MWIAGLRKFSMAKNRKMDKTYKNINELRSWSRNPRAIKKEDFERLKKHIQDHGQMQPLVITPDGEVLGGNMRLEAYKVLGINEVWVEVVEPKDETEKIKIALVLNDRAGFYQEDQLAELISIFPEVDLKSYKVDLGEPISLDILLDRYRPVEEDEAPPLPEGEPISKLGEVYQLGRHRLMCGDATKIEDVEKLMDGKKADMVFTDPPYGVDIKGKFTGKIKNDDLRDNNLIDFLKLSFDLLKMFTIGSIYICFEVLNEGEFLDAYEEKPNEVISWVKDSASFYSNNKYNRQYELIAYFKRQGELNTSSETNVWQYPKSSSFNSFDENGKRFNQEGNYLVAHPTTKPVKLCSRAIKNSSKQDDIVLDLFGGSGSTLIACEQTNRTCYMMEIDNRYTDVIIKRWQKFTGQEAIRISDGKIWNTLNQETQTEVKTESTTQDTIGKIEKE